MSELTPSEFKSLVIPYCEIERGDIKHLAQLFEEKVDIEKIIAFVNSRTLEKEWTTEKITQLDEMRKKLMERRSI